MKKSLILSTLTFLLSFTVVAQTDTTSFDSTETVSDSIKVKRFAIGAKIGAPMLIAGSLEVNLPVLNNRFSPYLDLSSFSGEEEGGSEGSFEYIEYGVNIYLGKKGKGFYVSLGQSSFDLDITFNDLVFESEGVSEIGSGSTSFNFNTTNLKIGVKTGGTLYFRAEIGYGLGDIPASIDFTSTYNGITETFSEELPELPGISESGLPVLSIGFGLAF